MMRVTALSFCVAAALAAGGGSLHAADLEAGDPAPDFELPGSDGKTYKLSDFKGEKPVIIAWFPKAFTGGWTRECISFRENEKALKGLDVAFFTASCDKPEVNKKFAEKLELGYPILSDPDKDVAKAYGVVTEERSLPYRWTFFIGKDGKILHIDKKVNTKTHGADCAEKLKELGAAGR